MGDLFPTFREKKGHQSLFFFFLIIYFPLVVSHITLFKIINMPLRCILQSVALGPNNLTHLKTDFFLFLKAMYHSSRNFNSACVFKIEDESIQL